MKELEIEGEWWLPEDPTNRMSGRLLIKPEANAILNLNGSIGFERIGTILGDSLNGKEISLKSCYVTQIGFIAASKRKEIPRTKLLIENVFLGYHFEEEPQFRGLILKLPYLSEWINKETFNVLRDSGNGTKIQFTPWSEICRVENLVISFHDDTKVSESLGESYEVKRSTFIEITSENEIQFTQLIGYLWSIRNFFDFATGKNTFPSEIIGLKSQYMTNPRSIPKQVEIILPAENDYLGKDTVITQSLPLPLAIIKDLEVTLQNWFKKQKELEWVFNLYFGYRHNSKSYLNDQFLTLVHALEVYYDISIKTAHMSEEEYKEKVRKLLYDAIPSNLDKDFKDDLKNQLKYGYQKRLRSKLNLLYQKKKKFCEELGINESLLSKIVKTRDYYTHYSEDREEILSGGEIVKATIRLRALLELFILEEISLNSDIQDRFIHYYKKTYNFFT